jgi:pyruvate,water dikinase
MKERFYTSEFKIPNNAPIGGKAKGLYSLIDLNYNVPPFIVIPWDQRKEASSIISELIEGGFLSVDKRYAVRSSANIEDGKDESFAGIFESILNAKVEDLPDKIQSVLDTVNAERTNIYHNEPEGASKIEMSVIVQEMIHADHSGVAFSIDPVTFEHKQIINAAKGLGDKLVSGEITGDQYAVKLDFVEKRKGGDPKSIDKDYILSDEDIWRVSEALDAISDTLEYPVDIEFCFEQNKLYLLQVRPITALPKGNYTVYDNSNIVESYPGITTPLTFSFINLIYTQVYKQFTNLMGVRKKEIEQRTTVFENTLGLVRGRVYYNLLNWYKMLAMAPGFSVNARYMETMMGVKERFNLKESYQLNKRIAKLRVVLMTLNILRIQFGLKRRTKHFTKKLNKVIDRTKRKELDQLSFMNLQNDFKIFEETLIMQWKAPLINDFFSMIWFGLLKKKCESDFQEQPNLHNDLLCGSQDIISTQPMTESLSIVEEIRKDNIWNKRFNSASSEELLAFIEDHESEEIPQLIKVYLERFGDRCIGELKLESISYKNEPALFLELLQSYLKEGLDTSVLDNNANEKIRDDAERFVYKKLSGNVFKRLWFNTILKNARKLVSNRENLRYERTRVFGLVREFFIQMGKRLEEKGVLREYRDIFYLEHDEILNIDLNANDKDVMRVVEERKKEFKGYSDQNPPNDRFFTYNDDFSDQYIYQDTKDTFDGDLKGIGCSPGIVEGIVCRVDDPTSINSIQGNIMVARSTDPGWVKLFPSSKAIIVEKGSLLSHTSIVAREMGIPCIVGVEHLLETLNDGDLIIMDGSKGTVEIIKSNNE